MHSPSNWCKENLNYPQSKSSSWEDKNIKSLRKILKTETVEIKLRRKYPWIIRTENFKRKKYERQVMTEGRKNDLPKHRDKLDI